MKIIQVLHPGPQYTFPNNRNGIEHQFILGDNIGIRYRNIRTHKRKFICSDAEYIDKLDGEIQTGKVLFWGEWESESFFKTTGLANPSPNAIHQPIYIPGKIENVAHCTSTDPYVFNKYHIWTHCFQPTRPKLRNLAEYSIILFGSSVEQNFVLDEVFVVGGVLEDWNLSSCSKIVQSKRSLIEESNLNFVGVNTPYYGLRFNNKEKIYSILNISKIFSFFPCKPETNGLFVRPKLPVSDFFVSAQTEGVHYLRENQSIGAINKYWNRLTSHLINEGYSLGLSAQEPQLFPSVAKASEILTNEVRVKGHCFNNHYR